jgi:antitoxin CptB
MTYVLAKLHWQCRRGTQELDHLLLRYLHTLYPTACTHEQQLFEQLLNYEDSDLLAFLLGQQAPIASQFTPLIIKIRDLLSD